MSFTTRSILVKNKLIDIINELSVDGVKAYRVYVDMSNNASLYSNRTNVFPIEERTKYIYNYEDGFKSSKGGETIFVLGGETWTDSTSVEDNDIGFQRYSILIDAIENVLIKYQDFTVSGYNCSLQLVESSSDAITSDKRIVFEVRLKVVWEKI